MERVTVFIDGSNLYFGLLKKVGHARINLGAFCDLLCGQNRRLVHTYYYIVPVRQSTHPDEYAAQRRFFQALDQIPHFTRCLGRLVDRERNEKCPQCGHEYGVSFRIEKGVDVHLATDMLVYAFDDQYDTAILVSQDGDYVPAVKEVLRLRKRVENADFAYRLPSHLSKSCSASVPLTAALLQPCLR